MTPRLSILRGDVLMRDGLIEAVGPHLRNSASVTIPAEDRIVLPGLINSHTHSYHMVEKGSREGLPLDITPPVWLRRLRKAWRPTSWRAAAEACYADSLLSGVVFVADVLGADALAECAGLTMKRVGISGLVYHRCLPPKKSRLALERFRVQFGITMPEENAKVFGLRCLKALAHKRSIPIRFHMHSGETAQRQEQAIKRWGYGAPSYLKEHGLLTRSTLLSHCGYHGEEDIHAIAESGAAVVLCPSSVLKLQHNLAPISKLAKAGVPILVGTDGPAFNNSNDLLLTLRLLCLMRPWGIHGDEGIHPVQALRFATSDAANWFGLNSGQIEAGREADIILIDSDNFRIRPIVRAPFDNLVANIILAATGQDVTDVIVRGRHVVRNRRLVTISTRKSIRTLQQEVNRALRAEKSNHC